jgi:L-iditol 2-dehydrogenase
MARKGGKVRWFAGLPPSDPIVHLDGNVVHYRDLTVYGTIAYTPRQFQLSVELVGSGKINPRRLVTDTVPLEQINEGFQKALAGQALKVVVTPNS